MSDQDEKIPRWMNSRMSVFVERLRGHADVAAIDGIDGVAGRHLPEHSFSAYAYKLDDDGFIVLDGRTDCAFEEQTTKELQPNGQIVETTTYRPRAPIAWGAVNLLRAEQNLPEFRYRPTNCEVYRQPDGTVVEQPGRKHYGDPNACSLGFRHDGDHAWFQKGKLPEKCAVTHRLPYKGDIDDAVEAPQYETCTYPYHTTGHHSWHRESFVDVERPATGEAVWAELCGVPKFIEKPAELKSSSRYDDIVGWTAHCQELRGHGSDVRHSAKIRLSYMKLQDDPESFDAATETLRW